MFVIQFIFSYSVKLTKTLKIMLLSIRNYIKKIVKCLFAHKYSPNHVRSEANEKGMKLAKMTPEEMNDLKWLNSV